MTTILIEKNVMAPMRDGVRLATDIYRLQDAGPQPVIMMRTPYNKEGALGSDGTFNLIQAVTAGYVVVAQDTRGRFASEGDFYAMFQERRDGYDAVQWAASQPWSSGAVGMYGGSYVGNTQWLAAADAPAGLKAIAPLVTFSEQYEGMCYIGGAPVLFALGWAAGMGVEDARRRIDAGRMTQEEVKSLDWDGSDMLAPMERLPLTGQSWLERLAPYACDWLAHPTPDAYWQPGMLADAYGQITAPALNIGGWYDCFCWGVLQNYTGMRRHGATEASRHPRLVMGPWTHGGFSGVFPERDFGPKASVQAANLTGEHMRWYDRYLKGIENGIEQEKPVRIFVMGIDRWCEEDDWPLPDARATACYLHSDGQANTLRGNGRLSFEAPTAEPADVYLYNPLRPAPTMGGQVLLPGANAMGPRDQREVEARDDVLVYTSAPLGQPLEVTGPVALVLWITSSARDTDFMGKLVDVFPDGKAINLTEGTLRARYRKSMTAPELLEPGAAYELTIDLWATANVFLPGHCLRLEVSSSSFPRLGRNSNTGGEIAADGAADCVVALNRVLHDAGHPSRLILPVVAR
ncbi:MAG: CocE/NonD family hydrolase [Anaerolineae bacterium]